ncbi:MAG: hypothetical protein Q9M43_03700 [Sulfurimonas sp.]|nr:hypothetical protein [Sulfurimonas sp.]
MGKCALNISVGITDTCEEYKNMEEFIEDKKLKSYFALLTLSIQKEDIPHLPSQYQDFSLYLYEKDYVKANNSLLSINKATSALVCASLLGDKISTASSNAILKKASHNGYKKASLYWLKKSPQNAKRILLLQ